MVVVDFNCYLPISVLIILHINTCYSSQELSHYSKTEKEDVLDFGHHYVRYH